jgi:hypothetical protein
MNDLRGAKAEAREKRAAVTTPHNQINRHLFDSVRLIANFDFRPAVEMFTIWVHSDELPSGHINN